MLLHESAFLKFISLLFSGVYLQTLADSVAIHNAYDLLNIDHEVHGYL